MPWQALVNLFLISALGHKREELFSELVMKLCFLGLYVSAFNLNKGFSFLTHAFNV
jgi:hypothetical protein